MDDMDVRETFTINEILRILNEMGFETELFEDDEAPEFDKEVTYTCISLDETHGRHLVFALVFPDDGPVASRIDLGTTTEVEGDPFTFINDFNLGSFCAIGMVEVAADGSARKTDDGAHQVIARCGLSFVGGVTEEHVRHIVNMWIEDLYEFMGFEPMPVDGDFFYDVPETRVLTDEVRSWSIHEQINWVLLDGGPRRRTAREIADILQVELAVVNHELHSSSSYFGDGDRPPRWIFNS